MYYRFSLLLSFDEKVFLLVLVCFYPYFDIVVVFLEWLDSLVVFMDVQDFFLSWIEGEVISGELKGYISYLYPKLCGLVVLVFDGKVSFSWMESFNREFIVI